MVTITLWNVHESVWVACTCMEVVTAHFSEAWCSLVLAWEQVYFSFTVDIYHVLPLCDVEQFFNKSKEMQVSGVLPYLFSRFPVFQDCTGKTLVNLCKVQTWLLSTFDSLFLCVVFKNQLCSTHCSSFSFFLLVLRFSCFCIPSGATHHCFLVCLGCYLCLHLLFALCTLAAIQSQCDIHFLLPVGYFRWLYLQVSKCTMLSLVTK